MKVLVMISYFIVLLASMGYVLMVIVKEGGFTFISILIMSVVACAISIIGISLEDFDKTKKQ